MTTTTTGPQPVVDAEPDTAVLLRVDGLRVTRDRDGAELVRGVSYDVASGRMHALVGESGSGKSVTARASMGLLAPGLAVTGGSVRLHGTEQVGPAGAGFAGIHGSTVTMVMQNPRTALHPMVAVGRQMDNILRTHTGLTRRQRRARCLDLLGSVGLPQPERVLGSLPSELSGGMAQRAVIATALLCEPDLVIADEPTTGLDPTVARKVLELIREVQEAHGLGVLLITHDLAVVAHFADTMSVMTAGELVEEGRTAEVLTRPRAPYTRGLVAASRPWDQGPDETAAVAS
ncbi:MULTISPECIES: ABC transporter ATP-binding protein [unclassified Nocardioides]|uniref:ABC transporter ATP-binding protein n=1 Tax=unclassified Nocardioides TaxID=2615069 RepID=UPI003014AB64